MWAMVVHRVEFMVLEPGKEIVQSEIGEENTFPTSESIVVALGSIGSESPV